MGEKVSNRGREERTHYVTHPTEARRRGVMYAITICLILSVLCPSSGEEEEGCKAYISLI